MKYDVYGRITGEPELYSARQMETNTHSMKDGGNDMMIRFRIALAMLMIVSAIATTGIATTRAQSATPISVPTATSAGCDQIPVYVEARQKIMDEMLLGIGIIFPTVATPIAEHGDQFLAAMMALTEKQASDLGKLYAVTADEIARLDVPEIAKFYNDHVAELYRLSGKVFTEAEFLGMAKAGEKYGEQLGALATAIGLYGASAIAVCPVFADVTEIDQTQIGA